MSSIGKVELPMITPGEIYGSLIVIFLRVMFLNKPAGILQVVKGSNGQHKLQGLA